MNIAEIVLLAALVGSATHLVFRLVPAATAALGRRLMTLALRVCLASRGGRRALTAWVNASDENVAMLNGQPRKLVERVAALHGVTAVFHGLPSRTPEPPCTNPYCRDHGALGARILGLEAKLALGARAYTAAEWHELSLDYDSLRDAENARADAALRTAIESAAATEEDDA